MSWQHVKSECVTLAKAKALEFATKHTSLPHSPVERTVDKSRVKKLVEIIRSGLALPFHWATVDFEGGTMRMNGQHSSAAIIEVGPDLPERLSFHFDGYTAETRTDMVDLFRQFDQRWSGRSAADVAGAYQGLIAEIADCNRKVMMVAAKGISWWKRTVEGAEGIPNGDDTYDLLHYENYRPFYVWINGIWNGRKDLIGKKETVAAMFATFEVSQAHATAFWREISYGPDYFTDDMQPGAVLIGEISRAVEDKDFAQKEFSQSAVYYKKSIKAWRAFCGGQRIASLKVSAREKGWPEVTQPGELEEAA